MKGVLESIQMKPWEREEKLARLLEAAKAVLAKLESPTGSVTILDQERLAAAIKFATEE